MLGEEEHFFKNKIEEITIEEMLEILDILNDTKLGNTQKVYYLILVLIDIEEERMEEMSIKDFELFDVTFIEDILKIVTDSELKPYVEIEGEKYGYSGEDNISIKQIIDVEFYRNEYEGDEALLHLLSIIVRPIISEIDSNNKYEVEKYDTKKSEARLDIIKKGKAIDLYPILIFFFVGKTI